MNQDQLLADVKQKLQASSEHFANELKKLRTGRAHSSMLDGVMVEVYGTTMPLNQTATISAPEAQLLQITPFDPANLQAIASAIRDNQTLGLNPVDDGRIVRVPIPPLTAERRQQIVKQLSEKVEETMIQMRGVRHESLKSADELKRARTITEDDYRSIEKQIDDLMSHHKLDIEQQAKTKETDIMTL
jgi:ribosome recycling factor